MNIQPYQRKMIHAVKNRLGLDDAAYRCLLAGYGVTSSNQLTDRQAAELTRDLTAKAVAAGVWEQRAQRRKFAEMDTRVDRASSKQLRMIESVWHDVSRQTDPEARGTALRRFVARTAKVDDIRFLTKAGATQVLTALTKMRTATKEAV